MGLEGQKATSRTDTTRTAPPPAGVKTTNPGGDRRREIRTTGGKRARSKAIHKVRRGSRDRASGRQARRLRKAWSRLQGEKIVDYKEENKGLLNMARPLIIERLAGEVVDDPECLDSKQSPSSLDCSRTVSGVGMRYSTNTTSSSETTVSSALQILRRNTVLFYTEAPPVIMLECNREMGNLRHEVNSPFKH